MKKILAVSVDPIKLNKISSLLREHEHASDFNILTAETLQESDTIFKKTKIDIVIIDLYAPSASELGLLKTITKNNARIPFIVMTHFESGEIESTIKSIREIRYFEKPVDFPALADKVVQEMAGGVGGVFHGISLASFLQMSEMEGASYTLKVTAGGQEAGRLYLQNGTLVAAATESAGGEDAVYQILDWDRPTIEIDYPDLNITREINQPLLKLLMEMTRRQDAKAGKVVHKSGKISYRPVQAGDTADTRADTREDTENEKTAAEKKKAAVEKERAALEREKAALAREKAALEREKAALEKEKAAAGNKKVATEKEKVAAEKKKAAAEKEKAALEKKKAALEKKKAAAEQGIVALEKKKAAAEKKKAAAEKEAAADTRKMQESPPAEPAEKTRAKSDKVPAADEPRTTGNIMPWWNNKKIRYSIIAGISGFVCLGLFAFFFLNFGQRPPGKDAVNPSTSGTAEAVRARLPVANAGNTERSPGEDAVNPSTAGTAEAVGGNPPVENAGNTGRLYVNTNDKDATITLPDIDQKYSPGMLLTPGKYKVIATAPTRAPIEKTAIVSAGTDNKIDMQFPPDMGTLYVTTEPSDAVIKIMNYDKEFHQGIELPAGKYQINAESGFAQASEWVTVSANTENRVSLSLTPAEVFTNTLGMKFKWIAPGSFTMGSPTTEAGRDMDEYKREVTISKGFYIQTTEVTQKQWRSLMGNNPSYFKACGENCPVENISWQAAQEFIKKIKAKYNMNYDMPTEAEWEYACRAGSKAAIYTGPLRILSLNNGPELDPIAWYGGNSCADYNGADDCAGREGAQTQCQRCGTQPVARKRPNAWGLYDMLGNVWEWCSDWYNNFPGGYQTGSVTDPKGPSMGTHRIIRGGCWFSGAAQCRSAFHDRSVPTVPSNGVGLRVIVRN